MPTMILRVLATVASGPMLLVGIVWILHGLNLLPGSFMTGDIKWAVFGVLLSFAGVTLVWWLNRRRPR